MTKKTLQLMATLALAAGIGFSGVTAHAAEGETPAPGTTTTQATVELKPGDGGTGGVGSISLEKAPGASFSDKLNGTTQVLGDAAFTEDSLVVNDKGSGTGWTVHVNSSAFKDTDNGSVMKASEMAFLTPVVGTVTGEDSASGHPTASGDIKFASQGSEDMLVFSAAKDAGVGQWAAKYTKPQFTVAGGNKAGNYASTLTWTLSNAPGGTDTGDQA
ncbi:WxL domain-containing protein [Levilactobacillus tangyuanensis]|uniref:WxL domain-containing protein n=1 Tax=Levilactobacillus tangyuanensis TaxID=2486021 RepID=A0ABW1TNS5_9LACO|nr:WxL domain-containing protein [Levilactobacillus tangyuanensis]